jgi:transcriptional regulator with PAS, ATPase and Fis domain
MQAKLLRVIQDGEIRRVGSNQHVLVNVRVIAATNRDLQKLVIEKKFREDLFYRLNVLPIHLPALRERREDISLLIEHFLEKYSRGGQPKVADKNAMRLLMSYDWPGNVRELENEIERATVLTDGEISQEALSDKLKYGGTKIGYSNVSTEIGSGGMKEVRGNLERQLILEALEKTSNNKAKAAKVLGLSRYGLYKKMEKYGMS